MSFMRDLQENHASLFIKSVLHNSFLAMSKKQAKVIFKKKIIIPFVLKVLLLI